MTSQIERELNFFYSPKTNQTINIFYQIPNPFLWVNTKFELNEGKYFKIINQVWLV